MSEVDDNIKVTLVENGDEDPIIEITTENNENDTVKADELTEQKLLTSNPPKNQDPYDSDLELKEEEMHYDHSGRTAYISFCNREGVIPAGFFLRHIQDRELDMSHHGLRLGGIKPICASLVTNSSITVLDLTDNWLGDESIPYLMAMMKENCFISDLTLSNNNITSRSAEIISTALSENMQLKRLNLSHNSIDDKAALALSDLIIYSNKLEYLNLSKNDFGAGCLAIFGRALTQTNSITEFDISWNHLLGKDTKHFCAGLIDNLSIIKLNLGWNGFGAGLSMQDFGKMLKANSTLEELDLSNNRVTAEGAVLFGRGLTANNTLKILKLGKNPMQTAGCYATLSAVLKNPDSAITLLDFEDIRVNQDFLDLRMTAPEQLQVKTGSRNPPRPSSSIHPVKRLKTFVRKQNAPLLPYFKHFDDAENTELTVNDFKLSLQYFCKDSGFDMTENEIELLIKYLDKKQNGFISYKDFSELNPLPSPSEKENSKNELELNNNEEKDEQSKTDENEEVRKIQFETDQPIEQ